MDIIFPYSETKIKPYLKMAIQRLQIAKNKKINLSKHEKREIGQLLGKKKEELARVKTEHIVREDFTIEAYELLELLCELIHERIRLITNSDGKVPPEDLKEAMASVVWASSRITIEEMNIVRDQLRKKFGSKFIDDSIENTGSIVNKRLIHKLSTSPPEETLVNSYMKEIAKEFEIDWEPTVAPTGFSIPMAPGTELRSAYQREPAVPSPAAEPPPVAIIQVNFPSLPQPPSQPPTQPPSQPPNSGNGNGGGGGFPIAQLPPPPLQPQQDRNPTPIEQPLPTASVLGQDSSSDIPIASAVYIKESSASIGAASVAPQTSPPLDDSFDALQARLAALRNL